MYRIYNFKTRGIGVISTKEILNNSLVGYYFTKIEPITIESRFIYDGWIETNPLGRYINHNRNPNCRLVLNNDVIEIYTKRNIEELEEITVNYLEIVELISLPESLVERYAIKDYDYIEENIIKKTNII